MFKVVTVLDVVIAITALVCVNASVDTLEIDASTKLSLVEKIVLFVT